MACLLAVHGTRTYKETTHVVDGLTLFSDGGSIPPTSIDFRTTLLSIYLTTD